MNKLKIVVIGLGKQMTKDHVPAVLRRNDLEIIAVVDKNKELSKSVGKELNVRYFTEVSCAVSDTKPDLAIVCVPHNAYFDILEVLAKNHIATLKEKPLAITHREATEIIGLYQSNNTYLQICVQRRFSKLYETTKKLVQEIGSVYSMYIEYTLSLNAEDMKTGWRADRKISGGGATIDMGYHIIDLLTYIFGLPDKLYAQLNYNSVGKGYTIDDTMKALMTFNNHINANIVVTKVFNQKNEKIRIFGDKGSVYVDGRSVTLFDSEKNEIESYSYNSKDYEMDQQLEFFVNNYNDKKLTYIKNNKLLSDQEKDMIIIDAIYKSGEEERVIKFDKESV